jgi:hypothetical protein
MSPMNPNGDILKIAAKWLEANPPQISVSAS